MEEAIREFLNSLEFDALAWIVLFLAAGIEYVFPPFPGDTIVLAGAFLVSARDWPLVQVFLAITLGSLVGMAADHAFGRWIATRDHAWRTRSPRWAAIARRLDALLPWFSRRPALYLTANRFLPSIRGLFFVAAGMTRVPLWKVLLFGGLSAVAWNVLLFVAGASIGAHWEQLADWLSTYNRIVWGAIALLVVVLLVRAARRRRRVG